MGRETRGLRLVEIDLGGGQELGEALRAGPAAVALFRADVGPRHRGRVGSDRTPARVEVRHGRLEAILLGGRGPGPSIRGRRPAGPGGRVLSGPRGRVTGVGHGLYRGPGRSSGARRCPWDGIAAWGGVELVGAGRPGGGVPGSGGSSGLGVISPGFVPEFPAGGASGPAPGAGAGLHGKAAGAFGGRGVTSFASVGGGRLVPGSLIEHVQVARPFRRHQQLVVGELRRGAERRRRRVVRGCRRSVDVVGVGDSGKGGLLGGEGVERPSGVAALLEDRLRGILIGPLAVELATAAEVGRPRSDRSPCSRAWPGRCGGVGSGGRGSHGTSKDPPDAGASRPTGRVSDASRLLTVSSLTGPDRDDRPVPDGRRGLSTWIRYRSYRRCGLIRFDRLVCAVSPAGKRLWVEPSRRSVRKWGRTGPAIALAMACSGGWVGPSGGKAGIEASIPGLPAPGSASSPAARAWVSPPESNLAAGSGSRVGRAGSAKEEGVSDAVWQT